MTWPRSYAREPSEFQVSEKLGYGLSFRPRRHHVGVQAWHPKLGRAGSLEQLLRSFQQRNGRRRRRVGGGAGIVGFEAGPAVLAKDLLAQILDADLQIS